jgi:2-C-methyl-D-erythritol 2,4-cyclodiphosphate synthase
MFTRSMFKREDIIDQSKILNNIAKLLDIDTDQVSVKATTTEKLGFIGREEGIMTQTVVLIEKVD